MLNAANAGTVIAQGTSVELINNLAAGLLVQSVNILGNNSLEFTGGLQLCKLVVGGIWLKAGWKQLGTIKSVELYRVTQIKRMTYDCLRRILPLLVVKTINTAKIRNAGFGRNPGAAKKDDIGRFVDYFLELGDFFVHVCLQCGGFDKLNHHGLFQTRPV